MAETRYVPPWQLAVTALLLLGGFALACWVVERGLNVNGDASAHVVMLALAAFAFGGIFLRARNRQN